MKHCLSASLLVTAAASSPIAADEAREVFEEVIVIAHPLSGEGLAQAAEIVEGEELLRDSAASIGATLANQPGIHSSSFGQASSRPVIHGLAGARVKVMEDRIDTLDASVTSGDHAVTVESFIADRIEVLKGPSTLLYGSGAIGGVVDVHTGRIPHQLPEQMISGRVEIRGGDNGDQTTAAARIDGGTGYFAWHFDGFTREADPYEIPGFAESARQRAREGADGDHEEEEETFGILPGSQLESSGGALGASYIGDRGFFGVAISTIDSDYGLPGGHGHEEDEEEEADGNPTLEMEQTRVDLEAAWENPLAGFESANVRIGINDYEHQEIEPNGEPATLFTNEAVESRVELMYEDAGMWSGAIGLQYANREFAAVGDEAFVPPVDTASFGLFWVGERPVGDLELETGFRIETIEHEPVGAASRSFTGMGASLGAVLPFANGWRLGLIADYSSRAPVAEELYSDGPHLATTSFEVGDLSLDEEKAFNVSATIDFADDNLEWITTVYLTKFSDFIYQQATGEIEDQLPVLLYQQADATFFGVDAEVNVTVASFDAGRVRLRGTFDTVSAELDRGDNQNLPRIPPTRFGTGIEVEWGRWTASLDYLYTNPVGKNDVAALELPTDSYSDLRAFLSTTIPLNDSELQLFFQGRNLADREQRNHTSFIKDFAPLPGRTLEAGVRVTF